MAHPRHCRAKRASFVLPLTMHALPGYMHKATQTSNTQQPTYALPRNQTRLLVPVQPTHARVRTGMCMRAQQGSQETIVNEHVTTKGKYHSSSTHVGVHARAAKYSMAKRLVGNRSTKNSNTCTCVQWWCMLTMKRFEHKNLRCPCRMNSSIETGRAPGLRLLDLVDDRGARAHDAVADIVADGVFGLHVQRPLHVLHPEQLCLRCTRCQMPEAKRRQYFGATSSSAGQGSGSTSPASPQSGQRCLPTANAIILSPKQILSSLHAVAGAAEPNAAKPNANRNKYTKPYPPCPACPPSGRCDGT